MRSPNQRWKKKKNPTIIACAVPERHPQLRRVNVKRKSNSKPLAWSWLNVSSVSTVHPKPPQPWALASRPSSSPQLHFPLGKKREALILIVSLELDLPSFSREVCPFVWSLYFLASLPTSTLSAKQFYWKILLAPSFYFIFFFFSVIAASSSHWLTRNATGWVRVQYTSFKTLCIFTADGNQRSPYQAHHHWQDRPQTWGNLTGVEKLEPDWQVLLLLIPRVPVRMGHPSTATGAGPWTRKAWSGGFYLGSPWDVVAACWVFFFF